MAKSGNITTNTAFGHVRLAWTLSSQNIAKNTSTISYTLSISRNYAIQSTAAKKYSIKINGKAVASGTNTIGGNGTKTLKTGSVTIPHNADGKKTFALSFSQEIAITWSGSYIGTVTGSGNGTLDTIPRTSSPSLSASSRAIGSSITISTNRASTAFTHTVTYSFNGASGTIGTGVGASVSWTLPNSLANRIPNATSGKGTITVVTYSGSTRIGSKSVSFTATVPSNATFNPSISGINHSEANSNVKIGAYVKGVSRVSLSIAGASAKYGATIRSYSIKFDGNTFTRSSGTTPTLKGSGTLKATASITDSRGRTASREVNITVLNYAPPKVTQLDTVRAESDGQELPLGAYVKALCKGSISPLTVGSTQRNTGTYTIRTKERTASSWTTKVSNKAITGTNLNANELFGTFDVTKSYDIRLEFKDLFTTTIVLGIITSGAVAMSWGVDGVGIGKIHERGALDVGGDLFVSVYENQLWSSENGMYMNASQTATPSKKLSECTTGWILQWQRFIPGDGVRNDNFQYTYVPKVHSLFNEGRGIAHPLGQESNGEVRSKYLYVYDDRLEGHSSNSESPRNTRVLTAIYEF